VRTVRFWNKPSSGDTQYRKIGKPNDLKVNLNYITRATQQRRAKSIRSLIFYYIFHMKPHFFKTLFQIRLLFDFDDFFFTNKDRIKCSFTL
jgi:hypothetical protein